MSYNAKVYKVFIASPDDVRKEREVVRSVIARWNAINSESKNIVLLPVGWETHAAPEVGKTAQEYINEEVLDKCDILIGIFWTKIGSPTRIAPSGSVEEIQRHISEKKLAMIYFSQKPIPSDADLMQVSKVREFKNQIRETSLYGEYMSEDDLDSKLYNHLEIKITEGKFRATWDSDILSKISDDNELATKIGEYSTLVAMNVLKNIVDENRNDIVWDAIVQKLARGSADLRETLIFLAKRGAFRHMVYEKGYNALAKCNQTDFCSFMNTLYLINKYEFQHIYQQGLLEDSDFARKILELIRRNEQ